MIKLRMKKYNTILITKQQKYQYMSGKIDKHEYLTREEILIFQATLSVF